MVDIDIPRDALSCELVMGRPGGLIGAMIGRELQAGTGSSDRYGAREKSGRQLIIVDGSGADPKYEIRVVNMGAVATDRRRRRNR